MQPVAFDVPVEVAFDYLVEPRNRPEWQSSLRRVDVAPRVVARVGAEWVDVTRVGLRARMRLDEVNRPELWSEWGEWRDHVRARLTLGFVPTTAGCLVVPDLVLGVDGPLGRPIAAVLSRLAAPAVRADLRRAARLLSARSPGH
jgi:hypothetical protein